MTFKLTAQEWFDAAWERAKNPIKSEIDRHTCTYNKHINGGCFIGCAIPDDSLANIGTPARTLVENGIIAITDMKYSNGTFLNELQRIHDCDDVHCWRDRLIEFAKKYNLQVPE